MPSVPTSKDRFYINQSWFRIYLKINFPKWVRFFFFYRITKQKQWKKNFQPIEMILTFSFWNLLCVRSFICDAIFVYSFVGLLIEHYNWSCVEIWFTLQHKTPNTNWFAAHSCCVTPSMFFSNPFRFPLFFFFLPQKHFVNWLYTRPCEGLYSLVSHFSFSLSLHLCVHPIYLFVLRILIVCLLICFSVSLSQFLGFVCTRICACLRYTFSQLFTLDMYLLRPYILIWRKTDRRHSLPVFRLVEILLMIFFLPLSHFLLPNVITSRLGIS